MKTQIIKIWRKIFDPYYEIDQKLKQIRKIHSECFNLIKILNSL